MKQGRLASQAGSSRGANPPLHLRAAAACRRGCRTRRAAPDLPGGARAHRGAPDDEPLGLGGLHGGARPPRPVGPPGQRCGRHRQAGVGAARRPAIRQGPRGAGPRVSGALRGDGRHGVGGSRQGRRAGGAATRAARRGGPALARTHPGESRGRLPEAIDELKRAIALRPGSDGTRRLYSEVLVEAASSWPPWSRRTRPSRCAPPTARTTWRSAWCTSRRAALPTRRRPIATRPRCSRTTRGPSRCSGPRSRWRVTCREGN